MIQKHKRMELIGVFTGLRKNKDKKMVVLREKNGRPHQGILGTGRKIVRRDLESNFMPMGTSMKECGDLIKDMVKGHTGEMKQAN